MRDTELLVKHNFMGKKYKYSNPNNFHNWLNNFDKQRSMSIYQIHKYSHIIYPKVSDQLNKSYIIR